MSAYAAVTDRHAALRLVDRRVEYEIVLGKITGVINVKLTRSRVERVGCRTGGRRAGDQARGHQTAGERQQQPTPVPGGARVFHYLFLLSIVILPDCSGCASLALRMHDA
ncbi:hypothetical protein ACFOQM_08790 [Paenibacillus sp. GCM10012307]|uniref:Uncharacterized protein n=1 Tax=Paenibacillus roseus TaxID=2798579 RepID=A0A934J4I0_9BACL|nr:hypothetical protein [Paenibacillus roseus]MBJ6361383.1 hypothetical protein [Paenibacillus roseus]